ncbi:DEAD/DEAH box helicase [Faecalibaculum rodentium]|uniref:Helicase n=1 Tax=Faecalibaculum rodentium TaxID=1702221 RepID=A0A1Q9YJ80_9FIRM|nr:DEAD/DEAH box helicase [Faecalibaculum rodentium]OLU44442.1 hypothetical protein BO223_08280 [Faecalibaculum rodentium]
MHTPREEYLSEAISRDLETSDYLKEIFNDLLYNYSLKLFHINTLEKEFNIKHGLRFADLLSKSLLPSLSAKHKSWAQEIIILLNLLHPDDPNVKYYLGNILSTLGNFRGLQTEVAKGFQSLDPLDSIYFDYDKQNHQIPGVENAYFFHDQKLVYDGLQRKYFSYSGPTSMGKSFVVQTYIENEIRMGEKRNFAILVPTKALINEIKSNLISSLKEKLQESNYKIVTSAEDIALKTMHNFIFVMTPERFLYLLLSKNNANIDFLFIDEAHKISERGGRSTYYYKILSILAERDQKPNIVFASPNIPNPEVYLNLIPKKDIISSAKENYGIDRLSTEYSPVCQFKFLIDLMDHTVAYYDEYSKTSTIVNSNLNNLSFNEILSKLGAAKQNLVYCSAKNKVLQMAEQYSKDLPYLNNEELDSLSNDIANSVHKDCYLADFVKKGVAYHVGYLPSTIRLRIERCFEKGILKTIFCTSTLIEGINLPADNLFITSYKNGRSNLAEVEFRNLIGRVGRIKYGLFGNVFLVRNDEATNNEKYLELLETKIPNQQVSIDLKPNQKLLNSIVEDLMRGDIELSKTQKKANDKEFDAARKFSLILIRDIAVDRQSPTMQAFIEAGALSEERKNDIKEKFPEIKTGDDITISFDQQNNLKKAIQSGLKYPEIDSDGKVDYQKVVVFLEKLSNIFKWNIYERSTLGKVGKDGSNRVLRWYALILIRWISGNGLNTILGHILSYKSKHPETGVWVDGNPIADFYNGSIAHRNYVMASTMSEIEDVILFRLCNYFRKFSSEYKEINGVDHFDNDWYEFIEYGTTNKVMIYLQQLGFSRETALYIKKGGKYHFYEWEDDIVLDKDLLESTNIGIATEAKDVKYNYPDLFL